jgi:hypothetical protein
MFRNSSVIISREPANTPKVYSFNTSRVNMTFFNAADNENLLGDMTYCWGTMHERDGIFYSGRINTQGSAPRIGVVQTKLTISASRVHNWSASTAGNFDSSVCASQNPWLYVFRERSVARPALISPPDLQLRLHSNSFVLELRWHRYHKWRVSLEMCLACMHSS